MKRSRMFAAGVALILVTALAFTAAASARVDISIRKAKASHTHHGSTSDTCIRFKTKPGATVSITVKGPGLLDATGMHVPSETWAGAASKTGAVNHSFKINVAGPYEFDIQVSDGTHTATKTVTYTVAAPPKNGPFACPAS